MIVRETRKIDDKGRVNLPISIIKELGLAGELVYFEVTKNGNLMIKKVNKTEKKDQSRRNPPEGQKHHYQQC